MSLEILNSCLMYMYKIVMIDLQTDLSINNYLGSLLVKSD